MRISDWSSDVCVDGGVGGVRHAAAVVIEVGDERGIREIVLVAVTEEVDCVDGFFVALGDSGARVHIFAQPVCRHAERAFILRAATGGEAVEQSLQSTVVRSVELGAVGLRSDEHTSELQSLMRTSYAVFCLTKQITKS